MMDKASDDLMKVDRKAFSVTSLSDESDEVAYWLSKTPQERLRGIELMRRVIYGYEPASARLQRVFVVAQLKED